MMTKNTSLKDKVVFYLQTEWERGSAVYLWAVWFLLFLWIVSGVQKYDELPFFPYKMLGYVLLLAIPVIIYKFIRMFIAAPREGTVYMWGIIPIPKVVLLVLGGISICLFVLLLGVPLVVILRSN